MKRELRSEEHWIDVDWTVTEHKFEQNLRTALGEGSRDLSTPDCRT